MTPTTTWVGRGRPTRGTRSVQRAFIQFFTVLILLLATVSAHAHRVPITRGECQFNDDGTYRIVFVVDTAAFMFGSIPGATDTQVIEEIDAMDDAAFQKVFDEAVAKAKAEMKLKFNGISVQPEEYVMPDLAEMRREIEDLPAGFLPLVGIEVKGTIPEGARIFEIDPPDDFCPVSMGLGKGEDPVVSYQLLQKQQSSWPFPLSRTEDATGDEPEVPTMRWTHVAADYLVLGFEHILPLGLDHILFVLGLFLLSPKMKPLLWQVSAFTLAHTCTLALSILGYISLPANIVEPLIALSIAFIAVENLCTSKLKWWRPVVVFAFGLLHGLGFAGVLSELGLPDQHFAASLIAFNVGVELGQLAVILAAFATVGWFRNKKWYRPAITIPVSLAIAATGLYWTVERIMGG